MTSTIWGPLELAPGAEVVHDLGALRLHLRRTPEELLVRASHDRSPFGGRDQPTGRGLDRGAGEAEADRRSEPSEPDADWTRWGIGGDDRIELRPSFPDRPIVVATEQPFFLPPGGRARMFVRIPLFVHVDLVASDGLTSTLEQLPTLVLSDTWWGDFLEGEVAYWLGTRARRTVTDDVYEPFLAICPFVVINESEQPLPVERFVVNVAYLTLFGREEALWADEVQVRYQGGHEGSHIRYTQRVPDDAGEVERISGAREAAPRGLKARMFGKLRTRMGVS